MKWVNYPKMTSRTHVIIQTSFLGDAVLSLPMIDWCLRAIPDQDRVLVIGAFRNKALFEVASRRYFKKYQSRLHFEFFDKKGTHRGWGLFKWAKELKKKYAPIQNIFCAQRSFRSAVLAHLLNPEEIIGFSSGAASFLYTIAIPREWDSGYLEIEKNLDLLRAVFTNISAWKEEAAVSYLAPEKNLTSTELLVAFSLGSPWKTKQWDIQEAITLIKNLIAQGYVIHLLGDPSTQELNRQVTQAIPSKMIKDLSGKTTIAEWVDLISQAKILVSGDSAAIHVASDLGVPVVALFGPTVPGLGFAPWRKHSVVLGLDLECRPCRIHGSQDCPLRHHRCMKDLKAVKVQQAIEFILS